MAKKTKKEEAKENKQGNPPSPKASNPPPQEKKYSDAVKSEVFGAEQKDYQFVYQIRLFAPSAQLKIKDVIAFFKSNKHGKTLFGLERTGKDLLASFHSQENQKSIAELKSIKINKLDVKVEVFPPPARKSADLGCKFIMSKVPMTATGSGVAKALSPLQPTRFMFEKHDDKIRTGRVLFWSLKQDIPKSIYINGIKVFIKKIDTPQTRKDTQEATKEEIKETPKDSAHKESTITDTSMTVDVPETPTKLAPGPVQPLVELSNKKRKGSPLDKLTKQPTNPLEEDAPIVDVGIFKTLGLPTPSNHAVLSIYEDILNDEQYETQRLEVRSPIGKETTKTVVKHSYATCPGEDRYMLSVQTQPDLFKVLDVEETLSNEVSQDLYSKKRWTQILSVGNFTVLVIFKSRIFHHRMVHK